MARTLNTRIQLKHDTEANWNKATNFIPRAGEVIIYIADSINKFPRLKIGDGATKVSNLPFVNLQSDWLITDENIPGSIKNRPMLGSAATLNSSDFASAEQGIRADQAMPKSGGTFTGTVTLNGDPITNMQAATKQYVDNNVSIKGTLSSGTQIGILTINGVDTPIYVSNTNPITVEVQQSSTTPTAEFVMSTNTATSAELTGVLGNTNPLTNGQIIYYMTSYATPSSNLSIRLQYSNTSSFTDSFPIYIYGTTRCKTAFPAGCIITLIFYNNAFYLASGSLAVVQ